MTELNLETFREALRAELAPLRALCDGIPLIHRRLETIQQEQRMLKVAVNELARLQFTSGEVEALHSDVNAVMAKNAELELAVTTLRRELQELRKE